MPNVICFLLSYLLLLVMELIRGKFPVGSVGVVLTRLLIVSATIAVFTHSLYLLDRLFLALANEESPLYLSWHDWGTLSSWMLAAAYYTMLLRRPNNRIGIFVIPLLILLVGGTFLLPSDIGIRNSSASGWRLAHGVGMTLGTMLISLGMAMAIMYFIQSSWLRSTKPRRFKLQLPSLEYLESFGRKCLLGSAASIGFGMVSGVIMNIVKDGQVEWLDRGILFSGGLFLWLIAASITQWQFSQRGRGQSTAAMNIISFVVVVAALALVLSTPHGSNTAPEVKPISSQSETIEKDFR
ncbi:MAG: hypothetical protein MUC43_02825 [Pirellula sp.]|nr:hypothetical protein [Pirellula sp.]